MSAADQVIAALHSGADELVPVVQGLTPEQLTGPSAASEWTVAQVISHLGSGAVITQAGLEAALAGQPNPGFEANKPIWDRWNAMTPTEQRDGFLQANAELLARYDGLDAGTRESLTVDLGFLPEPLPLAAAATFRLNEFALHSWDVRVVRDAAATVHPDAVPLLLGQIGFMLGWLAKPAALDGRTVTALVRVTDPDQHFGLTLAESSSLGEPPAEPEAAVELPAEAWIRLVAGRLDADHTPAGVSADGALTLDLLRQVFPGY
jgi:uncharacterized protein (TIGR03083 family)